MNTTYAKQIEAISRARNIWKQRMKGVPDFKEVDSALNDAGSSLAALNLSDPYKRIAELEKQLKEANVNKNL